MKLRELFESVPAALLAPILKPLVKSGAKTAGKEVSKEVPVPPIATIAARTQTVSKAADAIKEKDKKGGDAAIIFGRFNPPHKGHREAWETASKFSHWYVGTNQSTQGPKDPLPYDVKIQAMLTIWPAIEGHIVAEQTWWSLASKVFELHGPVTLHVVTDENDAKVFVPGLQKQNGVKGPHGFYNFKEIVWEPAPRLSSATDLRAAVRANDRTAFSNAAGVDANTPVNGTPFFDLVARYLNQYPVKENKKVAEGSSGKVGRGGTKPIDKEKKAAMKNASTLPGLNQSTGSAYKNYRMGIALAGAPDYPTKIEADNWIGGDPLLSAYTDEEFEMIKKAALQVGAGLIQNWSGNRSQEVADVNKTSPVAKVKRNKYGV